MDEIPFEGDVWAEIDLDGLRHNLRVSEEEAGEIPLAGRRE